MLEFEVEVLQVWTSLLEVEIVDQQLVHFLPFKVIQKLELVWEQTSSQTLADLKMRQDRTDSLTENTQLLVILSSLEQLSVHIMHLID